MEPCVSDYYFISSIPHQNQPFGYPYTVWWGSSEMLKTHDPQISGMNWTAASTLSRFPEDLSRFSLRPLTWPAGLAQSRSQSWLNWTLSCELRKNYMSPFLGRKISALEGLVHKTSEQQHVGTTWCAINCYRLLASMQGNTPNILK